MRLITQLAGSTLAASLGASAFAGGGFAFNLSLGNGFGLGIANNTCAPAFVQPVAPLCATPVCAAPVCAAPVCAKPVQVVPVAVPAIHRHWNHHRVVYQPVIRQNVCAPVAPVIVSSPQYITPVYTTAPVVVPATAVWGAGAYGSFGTCGH